MNRIQIELQRLRKSLLDLTLRNRLLNYRESKVRTIKVVGEVPAEVYDALVLRERTLEFRSAPRQAGLTDVRRSSVSPEELVWSPRTGDELLSHHVDRYLDTPYDPDVLPKRLFHVHHEGRSVVEEQGYSVVHLALAFLEWYEADASEQPRLAPLILVPVDLERVRGDYSRVRWTGEDVFANISLAEKLKEHNVVLPGFEAPEDKVGIDDWLSNVQKATKQQRRWRVLSNIVLDFFSFTKFVMHKDLDQASWPEGRDPGSNATLADVLDPSSDETDDPGFPEDEIDDRLSARDMVHILDADPSQIAVIEDAKTGKSLVVQGPPGTGKSQTIANLIATALGEGRSVLFVSEKMAALEVVKARLDGAGLGPFCLELHSRKSNKKAVLAELQRSLESRAPASAPDQVLEEHERLKRELNEYARELREPIGDTGLSPFALISSIERSAAHFDRVGRTPPRYPAIASSASVGPDGLAAASRALDEVADKIDEVRPLSDNAWAGSFLTSMVLSDEGRIRDLIDGSLADVENVVGRARELSELSGASLARSLESMERAAGAAEVLASGDGGEIEPEILQNAAWNTPNERAIALIERLRRLQSERSNQLVVFQEATVDADIAADLSDFAPRAGKFFRLFDRRYRELWRRFAGGYRDRAPSTKVMVEQLGRLTSFQRDRAALRRDSSGTSLFGRRWAADRSDPDQLREFADWLVAFREQLVSEALTARSVSIVASSLERERLRAMVESARREAEELRTTLTQLVSELGLTENHAFGKPLREESFEEIAERLRGYRAGLSGLFRWAQFNRALQQLQGTAASPMSELILSDQLESADFVPFFRAAYAESLLRVVLRERPSVGSFIGEAHERKINRFRQIDASLAELNQCRLSRTLHDSRPPVVGGASRTSEAGILLGEFQRRRSHMPIRKLLLRAGNLIQRLKPCFLMSPLSIAQFLDPHGITFDLVIFDEASQVRPEDAVGALLRGKQLVVMGDTKQLPPTSFFDHLVETDDEDEEEDEVASASAQDAESILHLCARSFPTRWLNWHYRSRHESLIAISNLKFYDNQLRIYPSAVDWDADLGLQFRHLPGSVYDRGASSVNRIEARAVAEEALQHFEKWGTQRSLGIGTFNIKQQQAILEEVDLLLRERPELEGPMSSSNREHFFVKNLETIQGDERDVILISVGYGRDANGRMKLHFGALNKDGGERRLNVLITRAREKCVVFSNFRADDLPLERTTSRGVAALKAFLEYAEKRRLPQAEFVTEEADSPFEESVAMVLEAHGHEVRKQVGCGGFRIDIGVVDPENRGRYLLGVECDGAKYHSSPVARDRDRLRQKILEGLHWRIYRVWSTDWYRNRAETVERLVAAVERARAIRVVVGLSPASEPFQERLHVPSTLGFEPVRSENDAALMDKVAAYTECEGLGIPTAGELHLLDPRLMAKAVANVAKIEGPIHVDELVRRIRTLWGLQRSGNRIRAAVDMGIRQAARRRMVVVADDFVSISGAPVPLRRRLGDSSVRIEYIAEGEIARAISFVLEQQFGTDPKELIVQASRVLGILATSAQAGERIGKVMDGLIATGELRKTDDGRVDLATR